MLSLSKADQYSFMHQVVWTKKTLQAIFFFLPMPNFVVSKNSQLQDLESLTEEPQRSRWPLSLHVPQTGGHSFPRTMASWGSCSVFPSSWWSWRKTRYLGALGSNPWAESKISCDAQGAVSAIWTEPADAVEMGLCTCCYLWHPETSFPLRITDQ